jgi:hypothetical protein
MLLVLEIIRHKRQSEGEQKQQKKRRRGHYISIVALYLLSAIYQNPDSETQDMPKRVL